jgi:hypothetical protein
VLQSSIAYWSAKNDSLDVLLRPGDTIENFECRRVANAGATELIQTIDKNQELAVIKGMLEAFPESGFDLTGGTAGLRVLDSFIDVRQQVLSTNSAVKQLQK